MRSIFLILTFMLIQNYIHSQTWTQQQLEKANTAQNIKYLSEIEKGVIMYINLARLYPKDFIKIELNKMTSKDTYTTSLRNTLSSMNPLQVLLFDSLLYQSAKCHAQAQAISGEVGHKRYNCKKYYNSECCSYGNDEAIKIVLSWLIDKDVNNLIHRKICLNKNSYKIGVSFNTHKTWRTCAVADFLTHFENKK